MALPSLLRGADTVDAHEVNSLLTAPVRGLSGPLRPLVPKNLLICLDHAAIIAYNGSFARET